MVEVAKKEKIPGIGIAIWFGFLAIILPLLPNYFNLTHQVVRIILFVLAWISLAIGLSGAIIELRQLGFFEGASWENIGYAILFSAVAGVLHFVGITVPVILVTVGFKIIAVLFWLIALFFLAIALGQFLVEHRQKRDVGQATSSSRRKAVGASLIFLLTLLGALVNLVTRILEYLAVRR